MSYNPYPLLPTQPWVGKVPPVVPSLASSLPLPGGIGSLTGNGANGVLGRASTLASQVPQYVPGAQQARAAFPMGAGLPTSLLPGGAGAEASAAANGLRGTGSSLASRLLPNALRPAEGALTGKAASTAFKASLPGVLGTSRLARGGAGLATGLAADFAADKVFGTEDESVARQAGRGFVRGAGWGLPVSGALAATGVGAVGVPLVAIASGITGTIGAALDVLDAGKWFGGGGGEDAEPAVNPDEILGTIMETAQLDPAMAAQISDQYSILMQLAAVEEDDTIRAQAEAQALQTAGSLVLDALGQRDAISSDASNMLALQSQARDIFEPLAQDIEGSAAMYGQAFQGIRDSLPESMRGIADYQTAQELSSGNRLANAYRAQAAITPMVDRLTQYQQDFNSYAAQQFAQAMAQQAAGQGASLGPSSADVQAQLLAATG